MLNENPESAFMIPFSLIKNAFSKLQADNNPIINSLREELEYKSKENNELKNKLKDFEQRIKNLQEENNKLKQIPESSKKKKLLSINLCSDRKYKQDQKVNIIALTPIQNCTKKTIVIKRNSKLLPNDKKMIKSYNNHSRTITLDLKKLF